MPPNVRRIVPMRATSFRISNRQIEAGLRLALDGLEREWGVAERKSLEVAGAHLAGFRCAGNGAQYFHQEPTAALSAAGERVRLRYARLTRM